MDRTDLIGAIATMLITAFVVGWLIGLIVQRITQPRRDNMNELDRMAQQLHDAEERRAASAARLEKREAELSRKILGLEAELKSTDDALRDSRSEVQELHEFIETSFRPR